MNPEKPRKLPANLRDFLTVTQPKKPRTTKPAPSSLLSRVEAFLPELEAANKALTPGEKSAVIVDNDDKPAETGDVQMDIYVDNALGELVPTDKPKSLIEEVKEGEAPGK